MSRVFDERLIDFHYQLPTTSYPLPVIHYQLPTTSYPLPVLARLRRRSAEAAPVCLPIIHYQLSLTSYPLPVIHYQLSNTSYSSTTGYPLPAIHSPDDKKFAIAENGHTPSTYNRLCAQRTDKRRKEHTEASCGERCIETCRPQDSP